MFYISEDLAMEVRDTEKKLLELASRMQGLPVHPPEIVQEREHLWKSLLAKVRVH